MEMTLDEAILHAKEVAEEYEKSCKRYDDASGYTRSHNENIRTFDAKNCEKCAAEHRQLAKWLKDYKRLLEQEPCEDAISRQAAIECLHWQYPDKLPETKIRELPTVTPQQKTGQWITDFHGFPPEPTTVCSECGFDRDFFIYFRGWDKIKYCPNCGAKMVEPQESEDEE